MQAYSLLAVVSSYVPLLDELCCRTALFIKNCLESDSPVVSTVARYGIYYGHMISYFSLNAFSAVPVDILSVTRHVVSHCANSHISTQHRASVLFLLELLFVREDVLSCPLLSTDDIDMFVDFICISRCE